MMRELLSRALRKMARVVSGEPPPPIEITDEFLTWLLFANAGMLHPGNPYLMDYAIAHLPSDAPILEIGSFCGLSANVLVHLKRKHGRKNLLFTCDKWEFERPQVACIPDSNVSFASYKKLVRESFFRNIETFSRDNRPFTIEAFSDEFFAMWRQNQTVTDVFHRPALLGGPLSFCYVDGNHTYDGVKADFQNCDAFLQVGGFILFDDSAWEYFGVRRMMPEVLATGRYRLVARNPHHLFQKIKA